jgi:hypothetical protein
VSLSVDFAQSSISFGVRLFRLESIVFIFNC